MSRHFLQTSSGFRIISCICARLRYCRVSYLRARLNRFTLSLLTGTHMQGQITVHAGGGGGQTILRAPILQATYQDLHLHILTSSNYFGL